MYDWQAELDRECKEQKKRWNGKVITTSRQWSANDNGAESISYHSEQKMWDAVRDYYNSREWN